MTVPANAMPLPKMVAHRGAGDLMMPEASVEAYSNAVATAVDIVKLDLQYTKDGIVVMGHDGTLKRVMGLDVEIADWTYDDIKRKGRFVQGGRSTDLSIVRLDEALSIVKGIKEFWLDFKAFCPEMAEKVFTAFADAGIDRSRLMVATFNYKALEYMRAHYPEVRRIAHIGIRRTKEGTFFCTLPPGKATFRTLEEVMEALLRAKEEYGLFGVNMPIGGGVTTEKEVSYLHSNGLWVSLWFVQNAAQAAKCRGYGADAYVTDAVSAVTSTGSLDLQEKINVAAAGGGRVVVPAGTWVTKPLRLKSGVELHLEKGARLVASGDLGDYLEWTDVRHIAHPEALPRGRNASLIFADEAHDIAITGEGTIDCNGAAFVREKTAKDWTGWRFERTVPPEKSLPRAVFFTGCSNVVVRGVTLENPPAGWSYWFHDCDNVLVENADIKANVEYPNNDGYHVNSCRNVVIRNCDLETGDDSIIVRANNRTLAANKVCENVVVSNCTLRSWSSAVRLGWTNDGLIRQCRFRDLRIRDTSVGVSFLLPKVRGSDYGREATRFEDIVFENVEMSGIVGRPILGFVADKSHGTQCAGFKDIVFRNVTASGLEKPLFRGAKDCPIAGVTLVDCRFETVSETALPDYRRHGAAACDRFVGADDVCSDITVK